MVSFLKRIWTAAPIATVILGIAMAIAVVFSIRLVAFWIYWADPNHRDQTVAAWMTPGYIAYSWDIPRPVILEALTGFTPRPGRPMSLDELAEMNGIRVEDLIAATEAAIAAHRQSGAGARP